MTRRKKAGAAIRALHLADLYPSLARLRHRGATDRRSVRESFRVGLRFPFCRYSRMGDLLRLIRLVWSTRDRRNRGQECLERACSFCEFVTCAAVNEELRIMVEDIDNKNRLLHGASGVGCMHTNFEISYPGQ